MLSGISPTTDPRCHFRLPIAATWMPTGLCFLVCPRLLNIITTVPTAASSHWPPGMDSGRSSTTLSSGAQRLHHEGPLEGPWQDSWAQISWVWQNAPLFTHILFSYFLFLHSIPVLKSAHSSNPQVHYRFQLFLSQNKFYLWSLLHPLPTVCFDFCEPPILTPSLRHADLLPSVSTLVTDTILFPQHPGKSEEYAS